jgi:hypothetical protein
MDSPTEIALRTEDLAGGLQLTAQQIDTRLDPAADAWLLTRRKPVVITESVVPQPA